MYWTWPVTIRQAPGGRRRASHPASKASLANSGAESLQVLPLSLSPSLPLSPSLTPPTHKTPSAYPSLPPKPSATQPIVKLRSTIFSLASQKWPPFPPFPAGNWLVPGADGFATVYGTSEWQGLAQVWHCTAETGPDLFASICSICQKICKKVCRIWQNICRRWQKICRRWQKICKTRCKYMKKNMFKYAQYVIWYILTYCDIFCIFYIFQCVQYVQDRPSHIFLHIILHIGLHTATYFMAYSAYSAYCNMSNMSKIDPCILFYISIYILCIYICNIICNASYWYAEYVDQYDK